MEACVDRLKQYLTDNHVYFEVLEHRQAYTMQEVAATLHEKGEHVAKVFIGNLEAPGREGDLSPPRLLLR